MSKVLCYYCGKEVKEGRTGKAVVAKDGYTAIAHWFCFKKGQSK